MKINFEEVKFYFGVNKKDCFIQDVREQFADIIYRNGSGIASLELARKIYNSKDSEEYDEREIELIRQTALLCTPQFIEAIEELLKN